MPKEELAEVLLTLSLQFHTHGCFQMCPGREMTHAKKNDDDWRDPEYLVSVDAGWTGSPWIGTPSIEMDCNTVTQSSIQHVLGLNCSSTYPCIWKTENKTSFF